MKATLSAGFLFLGSILAILFGFLPEGGMLHSLLLITSASSGIVLLCEMFVSCGHEIVDFFSSAGLPDLKALVTPPPAEKIKEDSDDDRSE